MKKVNAPVVEENNKNIPWDKIDEMEYEYKERKQFLYVMVIYALLIGVALL